MKNQKVFSYIAAAVFAVVGIWGFVSSLSSFSSYVSVINIVYLLRPVGSLLIAVACLIGKKELAVAGAVLMVLVDFFTLVFAFISGSIQYNGIAFSIGLFFLPLLYSIFILLSGASRSNAKVMGFIAAGVELVSAVFIQRTLLGWISMLLYVCGAVLLGMAMDGINQTRPNTPGTKVVMTESRAISQINRLAQLKELLDKGIISQEDFDEKKKQILNM